MDKQTVKMAAIWITISLTICLAIIIWGTSRLHTHYEQDNGTAVEHEISPIDDDTRYGIIEYQEKGPGWKYRNGILDAPDGVDDGMNIELKEF